MGKCYKDRGSLYVRAQKGSNQEPNKLDSCAPAYTNAGLKFTGPTRPIFVILFNFSMTFEVS